MRVFFIVITLLSAIITVVLAVLPLYKLAFIPAIASLVFGFIAFYLSNKKQLPKHSIKLAFLLTILALGLTTYKSIFSTSEVGNTEELEQKEKQSEEEAIEELDDLELDELEL